MYSDPVIKREDWDPINRLNPATFVGLPNDFQRHMSWSFRVQLNKRFCWYWWN